MARIKNMRGVVWVLSNTMAEIYCRESIVLPGTPRARNLHQMMVRVCEFQTAMALMCSFESGRFVMSNLRRIKKNYAGIMRMNGEYI